MYQKQTLSQVSVIFFENGIIKRVPIIGNNNNALETDKSYLKAEKKTFNTSSPNDFLEKSGGIK